ncbi:UDP-N-acetylglucosamine 2-epimerase (non-hydrolyzing) [Sandaracinobacter neustonicus]|uniref:UDP-N-acetylglucosamine 2-epimerase (non-hydrolyzing) n=1 Tax=Sandaracinobacter neustonicus TaxID=1715348 RepID=A0A501XLE9_9SPHN|nr:UDP-N-acetylglucosamine 2-epimerase (non-hydrolyzing) [Sandaracinobacter neustonicus]TPE61123.1 UDP-N-acetylglucosamine 2-epimerase (non-hydrolyzing) [Sandaracinobacter neustonicus]
MHGKSPLLAVCGTRPEVVKMAPVIAALRARGQPVLLVFTGQHGDLAPQMLRELGLVADIDLGLHQQGAAPAQLLASILMRLAPVFAAWRPRLALVQGDTVSALAGALAAAYARVPVAHVEAGLRTGDPAEPFPEEMHRAMITPAAALHFAPTETAAQALLREGVDATRIHITGNSGIDALHATEARLDSDAVAAATLAARYPYVVNPRYPLLLATIHRRENIGRRLGAIAAALARLAAFCETEIVLPLHPNPAVQSVLREKLDGLDAMHLIPPVDHMTMIWMMRRARLLVTDSGGLQEEAPGLGLRTLVLRQATERTEALAAGASELVEIQADSIVSAVRRTLLRGPMQPVFPFGDGRAGERIADVLGQWLADTATAGVMAEAF